MDSIQRFPLFAVRADDNKIVFATKTPRHKEKNKSKYTFVSLCLGGKFPVGK
jgi:hypothetical protein